MAEISLIRAHPAGVAPQTALVTTKYSIPPTPPTLVARPHLLQRLNEGTHKKLTLLCASAGFGKTSLLAEWCADLARQRESPRPIAWVSLEADENDPDRFWRYVLVALQRVAPQIGEALPWLQLLQSPEPPPMGVILTSVINTLAAGTEQVVLILDDYHVIETAPIHSALTFLLEHLPPQMHLILASRSQPPLPLARWRSRGLLNELYTAELRFTLEEAAAFLHLATGRSLPPEAVATLEQRTEGWIVGLQLAALSLKGRDESAEFIRTFGGSHRYVLDYLSEEVLRQQPRVVQTFLQQTAILDRLTAALCEAVTGVPDSQAMLEYLEQANLFLVPLDDERTWYRYHHLFSELLLHRLRRSSPEQVPELHRRAADWYEQQGLCAQAVGHALTAVDYVRAARLIERAAPSMLQQERSTLKHWIEALPPEQLKRSPRLCLVYGVLLADLGEFEAVEPYLQQAEAALQPASQDETTTQMLGEIDSLRADIACNQGQLPHAIALCHQALERIPRDNVFLRGNVSLTLGASYVYSGELAAAEQALTEALELSQAAGNLYGVMQARYRLAWKHLLQGQLRLAYRTYQHALHLVQSHPEYRRSPNIGLIYLLMGDILREWNALDDAAQRVGQGIEHIQQSGYEVALPLGVLFLARVRWAQGRIEEATALMQQCEQLVHHDLGAIVFTTSVSLYLVDLWILQGNLDTAMQWGQQYRRTLESDESPRSLYTQELLTLARLLLAQARQDRFLPSERPLEEALSLLERVRSRTQAEGQMSDMLQALVLRALVEQAQGNLSQAVLTLREALTLAESEGYVRIFVDEGPPMAELLLQVAASDGTSPYIMTLLEVLGVPTAQQQGTTSPPQACSHTALMEPLSEREVEVLRLLATGRSNAEMAQALVVSVSTVRTHLRHIYGKLDVTNRTQAVARAREIHLLAS